MKCKSVIKSVIRSILMYECGTWAMTKAIEAKLRCFERKILKNSIISFTIQILKLILNKNKYRGWTNLQYQRRQDNCLARLIWRGGRGEIGVDDFDRDKNAGAPTERQHLIRSNNDEKSHPPNSYGRPR